MAVKDVFTNKNPPHGPLLEHRETMITESTDGFCFPEGTTYHLNFKKLRTTQLKRIAEALDLPGNTSFEDTRRMIEGRPTSVQVIVQGTGDSSILFLVDHEDIVVTVKATIDSHVTNKSTNTSPHSALSSKRGSRPLASKHDCELESVTEELWQIHMAIRLALEEERRISASQVAELAALKQALAKEKEKMAGEV